jgi:hypothetical protein
MKNPWLLGVGIPATLTFSSFLGYAILSHAEDEEKEDRLSAVEQVAVKLGKIHEVEAAKREQTIEHCDTGIITSCRVCRDVGIVIDECKK